MVSPAEVAVYPGDSTRQFKNMLSALERAFPVKFCAAQVETLPSFEVALVLADDSTAERVLQDNAIRSYIVSQGGGRQTTSPSVRFGGGDPLNRYLRGRILQDDQAEDVPVIVGKPGDDVLASSGDDPIWVRRELGSSRDLVSIAPPELGEGETLREHLSVGRFIRLLPVVHFIREATHGFDWSPPPLRACFILDDPNLRRPSYGYLRYPQLAAHAKQHNYHLAVATIPLDSWLINGRTAELFRKHPEQMSLLIHGNSHTNRELNGRLTAEQSLALLAHALRRVDRIEEKTRTAVSRVMVPPHEECNEVMLRAMRLLGFEAASINRLRWPIFLSSADPLSGWGLAEMFDGGFPVISRTRFKAKYRNDIPLLAFLNQPIVLYGHHYDVKRDLSGLAEIAAQVNSLGDVRWQNMAGIARSNYMTRQVGTTLFIRLYSRHVVADLPEGVEEVVFELATNDPLPSGFDVVVADHRLPLPEGVPHPRTEPWRPTGSQSVEIQLAEPDPVAYGDLPPPAFNLWAVIRRLQTETRDRLLPLLRR